MLNYKLLNKVNSFACRFPNVELKRLDHRLRFPLKRIFNKTDAIDTLENSLCDRKYTLD
jgi:hypothetical protein